MSERCTLGIVFGLFRWTADAVPRCLSLEGCAGRSELPLSTTSTLRVTYIAEMVACVTMYEVVRL